MASPASSASRTELRLRQRVLSPSLFAVGLSRLQQHPHGVAPLGTRVDRGLRQSKGLPIIAYNAKLQLPDSEHASKYAGVNKFLQ
uniref:Uncharacterized protein n=1 Tax=Aegilops tauschii TaxID=37682 RepID=M8C292_AEGTA